MKIDPEFRDVCPLLSDEERAAIQDFDSAEHQDGGAT